MAKPSHFPVFPLWQFLYSFELVPICSCHLSLHTQRTFSPIISPSKVSLLSNTMLHCSQEQYGGSSKYPLLNTVSQTSSSSLSKVIYKSGIFFSPGRQNSVETTSLCCCVFCYDSRKFWGFNLFPNAKQLSVNVPTAQDDIFLTR